MQYVVKVYKFLGLHRKIEVDYFSYFEELSAALNIHLRNLVGQQHLVVNLVLGLNRSVLDHLS